METSNAMWAVMQAMKGIKFTSNLADENRPTDASGLRTLWHGIDKYDWEILLGRRQREAKRVLVVAVVASLDVDEATAKLAIDDLNDNGDVVFKPGGLPTKEGTRPLRIFEQDRSTRMLRVAAGASAGLEGLGVKMDLNAALSGINDPP
eukprot:9881549-Lingulodinium_polyedra.AAC.1